MSLHRGIPAAIATALLSVVLTTGAVHCGSDVNATTVHGGPAQYIPPEGGGGGDDGGGGGCTAATAPGPAPGTAGKCDYTDDTSFCACLGMMDVDGGGTPFNCGGVDSADKQGINHAAYCGACPAGQFCKADNIGDNFGRCTPGNPIQYSYQQQKINMLVGLGENDSPVVQWGTANNIGDGRGYTISTVGFTTGTGDFIFAAACYNDVEPNNILQKYWGKRDSSGRALNGLIYYNDVFNSTGANQCDTSLIDSLGTCTPMNGMTCFQADIATASSDPKFVDCLQSLTNSFYLSPAAQHVLERNLKGALTIGFLFDTEINFGDDDDPVAMLPGTKTIMKRADADYGTGLPTDFTNKPWEESRWLGYVIKERTLTMSGDMTWMQDMDQNATWEAARRQHTATSNATESMSDLSMDYDFASYYKAAATNSGPSNATSNNCPGSTPIKPCWGDPPLKSNWDTCSGLYLVSTDKSASAMDASAMDPTQWTAKASAPANAAYSSCPDNPTP
jgi:hypothetical protein